MQCLALTTFLLLYFYSAPCMYCKRRILVARMEGENSKWKKQEVFYAQGNKYALCKSCAQCEYGHLMVISADSLVHQYENDDHQQQNPKCMRIHYPWYVNSSDHCIVMQFKKNATYAKMKEMKDADRQASKGFNVDIDCGPMQAIREEAQRKMDEERS